MHPFPHAGFSSTSGQRYITAQTNNARTASYPQPLQPSHGPYLATVLQGASTVPHDLAASWSLYAANHGQPVGYSTTSNHHPTRISSPVIPPRPENFMTSPPPSAPRASTSAQRAASNTAHIPPRHQSLRDDTPLDLTLMTPMLRIAIFTGEGEGALRSQTPVWALFVNRDPDYKERIDLLTIRQGSGTHSWEPASALKVSLRKCKDLVCVVELPSCNWPSYILLSAIERSQRMPQPHNIPWSSAHWVCYTIEKFATLADPAMRAPPFYWDQQLTVYDLWTTVWNAAIIHFADMYLSDRASHASRGQSVPRLDLERIEPNGVRLHMFPERTNITQELRLARTVLPALKGVPDRSRTLAFTFQYAVSRLGV